MQNSWLNVYHSSLLRWDRTILEIFNHVETIHGLSLSNDLLGFVRDPPLRVNTDQLTHVHAIDFWVGKHGCHRNHMIRDLISPLLVPVLLVVILVAACRLNRTIKAIFLSFHVIQTGYHKTIAERKW